MAHNTRVRPTIKLSARKLPTGVANPGFLKSLRRRLVGWYRRHARDLPWRRTRDPYAIWVSETMLQQTQVATVLAYYERFLAAFPDIRSLAHASEADVLRLWEGLGYYRRARQMHRAAAVLVRDYGGQFPRDIEQIKALPGVGRYTAGAIASIAFDQRAPIVEANTLRVYCRLLGYRGKVQSAIGQRLLWQTAESWLPRRGSGEFNQALMELGATVCKIRDPACERCPVALLCPTWARGLQEQIPAPVRPVRFESIGEAAVVVRDGQNVLLVRRRDHERWAGLWDFPRFPASQRPGHTVGAELERQVRETTGIAIALGSKIATFKHAVTRFRITLECFSAVPIRAIAGNKQAALCGGSGERRRARRSAQNGRGNSSNAETRWVRIGDLDKYAMSSTGRKLAMLLAE